MDRSDPNYEPTLKLITALTLEEFPDLDQKTDAEIKDFICTVLLMPPDELVQFLAARGYEVRYMEDGDIECTRRTQ